MEYIKIIKENGKYREEEYKIPPVKDECHIKKELHLCGEACKNAYANKCDKIYDKYKNIYNYRFITKGYQIENSDGIVESLIVKECTNYEKEENKNQQ